MGFIQRVLGLLNPRQQGSGKLWDNVNTPGATGWSSNTGVLPLVRPPGFVPNNPVIPLPNPEFYLKSGINADPLRLHAQPDTLLPKIPVREPRGTIPSGVTYVQKTPAAPGQPTVLTPTTKVPGLAPTQTRARELEYNGGNPATIRTPQAWTQSQRYFDQKQPLPEFTTPATFSHQVVAGNNSYFPSEMRHGWEQIYVPEPGMRLDKVGSAPPTLLSRPINVVTITGSQDGHRSPIKKAKAPKRARSGG